MILREQRRKAKEEIYAEIEEKKEKEKEKVKTRKEQGERKRKELNEWWEKMKKVVLRI